MMKSICSGLLVGGLAVSLAGCGGEEESDTDVDTETDTDTDTDTDEPEPDYFVPWLLDVDGTFAYDAESDTMRSFFVEGTEVPPSLSIVIYDERIVATSNIEFACSLQLIATGTPTSTSQQFAGLLDEGATSYDHWGMNLVPGQFEVVDAPYNTQSGTVEGCSTKELDPAIWGDDFLALVAAREWGVYVGDMSPLIAEVIEETEDDRNNDYDLVSLYDAGFIIGGSSRVAEPDAPADRVAAGEFYYTYAFAVDTNGWTIAQSGNEDDPDVRLAGADMTKTDERSPATGVYLVRSIESAWLARPLFGIPQ